MSNKAMPTRQVGVGGVVGMSLAVIIAWLLETYGGQPVPGTVTAALDSVLTTMVMYLLGPDKPKEV
jgi:hypothetical protein